MIIISAGNLGWSIHNGTVKNGSRSSCLEKCRLGTKVMPYRFCPATQIGCGNLCYLKVMRCRALTENFNKMPGQNITRLGPSRLGIVKVSNAFLPKSALLFTRTRSALRTPWSHLDGLNDDSENKQGVGSSFINLTSSFQPVMDKCDRSELVLPSRTQVTTSCVTSIYTTAILGPRLLSMFLPMTTPLRTFREKGGACVCGVSDSP